MTMTTSPRGEALVLVDTSVLIGFFKGNTNEKVTLFRQTLAGKIPFAITPQIYQEVLQGAKTEKEFAKLRLYLITQRFLYPTDPLETHDGAARIYFECRRKGMTIRGTQDCLIAQICLEHDAYLLHHDRDFDRISEVINLKVYL